MRPDAISNGSSLPDMLGFRSVLRAAMVCAAVIGASLAAAAPAAAQSAEGRAIYQSANCIGCHKWHGQGGGGYGGAALSLRDTGLDREDIIDVIRCGRGTRMPYHERRAWTTASPCYGDTKESMGGEVPPRAASFLRDSQIEAVTDYVIEAIQGREEPTKEECVAFWGDASRECDRF